MRNKQIREQYTKVEQKLVYNSSRWKDVITPFQKLGTQKLKFCGQEYNQYAKDIEQSYALITRKLPTALQQYKANLYANTKSLLTDKHFNQIQQIDECLNTITSVEPTHHKIGWDNGFLMNPYDLDTSYWFIQKMKNKYGIPLTAIRTDIMSMQSQAKLWFEENFLEEVEADLRMYQTLITRNRERAEYINKFNYLSAPNQTEEYQHWEYEFFQNCKKRLDETVSTKKETLIIRTNQTQPILPLSYQEQLRYLHPYHLSREQGKMVPVIPATKNIQHILTEPEVLQKYEQIIQLQIQLKKYAHPIQHKKLIEVIYFQQIPHTLALLNKYSYLRPQIKASIQKQFSMLLTTYIVKLEELLQKQETQKIEEIKTRFLLNLNTLDNL